MHGNRLVPHFKVPHVCADLSYVPRVVAAAQAAES